MTSNAYLSPHKYLLLRHGIEAHGDGELDFNILSLFSSPELKAQVSVSGCPSVRLSVNIHIFDFFSRITGPILTRLGTNHPLGGGN
jgi:hypothetical protein